MIAVLNNRRNLEKQLSVPNSSLSPYLQRTVPLPLVVQSKSNDYIKHQSADENKDKLQFVEVYQSFENTTYHSLVQLNPESNDESSIAKMPVAVQHISSSPSNLNLPQSHLTHHTHTATPRPYKPSRVRANSPINHANYVNHINGTTNRKHQIPFISEELSTLSTHSQSVTESSYPSILALKLSFTNQASNDDGMLLTPPNILTPPKNDICSTNFNGENDTGTPLTADTVDLNEEDDDDVISSDSSFYDNAYDEKHDDGKNDDDDVVDHNNTKTTLKPIIIKTKAISSSSTNLSAMQMKMEESMKKLTLKPDYATSKTTLLSTPKLNSRLLSGTDMSSLLDHADTYDPPQPSLHNSSPTVISAASQRTNSNTTHIKANQYKMQPMLQSVVEEVSEQLSLEQDIIHNTNNKNSKNKNIRYTKKRKISKNLKVANAGINASEYHHYQLRQEEFDKIINQNNNKQSKHNRNSLGVNVNININNNNNNNSNMPKTKTKTKTKKKNVRKKPNIIKVKKRTPDYRNRNINKSVRGNDQSQSSSLVITAKKHNKINKRSNVDIRRPHTSRELTVANANNTNTNIISRGSGNGAGAEQRILRYRLGGGDGSRESSDETPTRTLSLSQSQSQSQTQSEYSSITITSSISTTTMSTQSGDTIDKLFDSYRQRHKLFPAQTRNNLVYSNNANDIQRSSSINDPNVHRPVRRRPVRIIRRSVHSVGSQRNGYNNMVRATSAMNCNDIDHVRVQQQQRQQQRQQQKYGLFDEDSCSNFNKKHKHKHKHRQIGYRCDSKHVHKHKAKHVHKRNDLLSERDKLFLDSRYQPINAKGKAKKKGFDGDVGRRVSDLAKNCDKNILKRLSVRHNHNHQLCKKEVHDAYERGFLAGYFLGVNIMQQQQKDHDNKSLTK